jgi:hypothetical protein
MKKLFYTVILTLVSAFVGLFILPLKVETQRWIQINAPEENIWAEIENVQKWQSWTSGTMNKSQLEWLGGSVSISSVDKKNKSVEFTVNNKDGQGKLELQEMPEGLWLSCYYSFQAEYAPWNRLIDWLGRGALALEIDDSLQKIKNNLESK